MREFSIFRLDRITPLNAILILSILIFIASLVIIPLRFLLLPSLIVILLYVVMVLANLRALR